MAREYIAQCWSCLGEFDAVAAVWCACNARSSTKICPFCIHCFCQADAEYCERFWRGAPAELKEDRDLLAGATGSVGEALIRSNLLSTDQLVSALRWQKNRDVPLEDALVDLAFVTRENLTLVAEGKAARSGATVDLSHGLVDATLVSAVTVELCHRKRILPVSKELIGEKEVLTLAMAGPTDVETIDQIQTLLDCRVIPMIAPEADILERLRALFPEEIAAIVAAEENGSGVSLAPGQGRAHARRAVAAPPVAPSAAPSSRRGSKSPRRGAAPAAAPVLEETPDDLPALGVKPASEPKPGRARAAGARPAPVAKPRPAASAPPALATIAAGADEASGHFQKIVVEAVARKASSVQFEFQGTTLALFFRIDGNLFRARTSSHETPGALKTAIAAHAGLKEGPAAGRFALKVGGRRLDAVVRRVPSPGGESLILKLADPADVVRSLEGLGTSALDRDRISRAVAQHNGLVLLSGPPHNGVETTRCSLMAYLAREGRRVFSIEAPRLVEIPGARQEEIPPPATAAACGPLLAASEGSDVVFLPEIQSLEMAAVALDQAARRLVLAPIQARRASQTAPAFLWYQVPAATLGPLLRLVVNQRLVRRICEGCKSPAPATDQILKLVGLTADEALDLKIFQGGGCDRCAALSSGYSGRVALFEVMEGTPELAGLIAAQSSPGEIEREARRAGMSPLRAACLALVGQGITTLEEFQKGNF